MTFLELERANNYLNYEFKKLIKKKKGALTFNAPSQGKQEASTQYPATILITSIDS
jgi:hypothetical protein